MAADRIYVTLGGTVGKVEGQVPLEIIQGAHGKSAYEIAVRNGFVGTEKEWIDSLGQPARDAAEAALQTMDELETEFGEKEAERENTFENNESQRQFTFENNEAARQRTFDKNESMMVSEEQTRQSNEQKRIADEELRRRFESNRNDAELAREQAEQKREKAETDRQRFFLANETNRQTTFESNEEHRNREELVRQQNEEQRVENDKNRRGVSHIDYISGDEYNTIHIVMTDGEVYDFLVYNGRSGSDYILTESDKMEIASKIEAIPLGGLTKDKLSQAIQDTLNKADTALQPESISDMETKTHASANYQPKGNYLTQHQSLANYYTKTEIDSMIISTINADY